MNVVTSAVFGVVFLLLGGASTFLMYYLWGFPFDKAARKSEAPASLMRLHRIIGYTYTTIYIFMMFHMVPRMWQYQVELPPRTVAHLLLGFLIGIILLLKISIMRFYRHLEEWMPYLGTLLFVCTVLLMGLSLPAAYREGRLASSAVGGGVYSVENRKRVTDLLPRAGLPIGTMPSDLTTEASLRAGRAVLMDKCVRCHDLKTILTVPRSPADWVSTVARMAEKPAVFAPITEHEQEVVSAYLVAITPDLQKSAKSRPPAPLSTQSAGNRAAQLPSGVDGEAARAFNRVCSQCHAASKVDGSPPKTGAEVQSMLNRMSANGMKAAAADLGLIREYLTKRYTNSP